MLLYQSCLKWTRGISSAGRAPHWQCGGQRFDPAMLHHNETRMALGLAGFLLPKFIVPELISKRLLGYTWDT